MKLMMYHNKQRVFSNLNFQTDLHCNPNLEIDSKLCYTEPLVHAWTSAPQAVRHIAINLKDIGEYETTFFFSSTSVKSITSYTFEYFLSPGQWIFGKIFCNFWLFLNFLLCSASVYNLCVVSGDRYFAVTSPLKYLSRMNDLKVKVIIGIAWLFAFIFAGFVIYGTNVSKNNYDNCSIWGLRYEYSLTVLIIGYIVPVSFLVFVNCKVYFIAHSQMNRIHAQEMSLASVSHNSGFSIASKLDRATSHQKSTKTRLKHEIRIFKTFLIVICAFLVCWTPFVVILLIDSILSVPGQIRHSSIILLYLNSALNPLIYGYFNTEFRTALSGSLQRCMKRLYPRVN